MSLAGPVSHALLREVRTRVRQQGIVVWLDKDEHYTEFVDALRLEADAGRLDFAVRAFRGSYLEAMLALEGVADGPAKQALLVHLPGLTEESVRETPFFELYRAGVRYRKKLETLVTEAAAQRVPPEEIGAFVAAPGLSLSAADRWLQDALDGVSGGLQAQLRVLSLGVVIDGLLTGEFPSKHVRSGDEVDAIWAQLRAWTGLSEEWLDGALERNAPLRPSDVANAVCGWALAVEYVGDLSRTPVSPLLAEVPKLPAKVKQACAELAAHLRTHHAEVYQRTADEAEARLQDEEAVAAAEDLGKIDTFRFEEKKVLHAALAALDEQRWAQAAEWADLRIDGGSFWLRVGPQRKNAWQLVRHAARLGLAIEAAGPSLQASDLASAVERYREVGAAVDHAHRHLEQRRRKLLLPRLPEFETLRARLELLRSVWRTWADAWAVDFNSLCQAQGFLPPEELRQRSLFADVVQPGTGGSGVTAYFVIDGLRYEMGEELCRALAEERSGEPVLSARLAELPTVTEVGMNVLAPVVHGGRLYPQLKDGKILGFSTAPGEFRVSDPKTRKKAMQAGVGGKTCPWLSLEEVVDERSAQSLRRTVSQARLLVVHSEKIDGSGEKGVGLSVFDGALQRLRAAWRLLRAAGVRRFVITSDHGFLLVDDRAELAQTHGRKIDAKRRHVISEHAVDHPDEVRVPLSALGYEDCDGLQLHLPRTTAVFDAARRPSGFVHGGNSLQERVVPVVLLEYRGAAGSNTTRYELTAEALKDVAGMHRLKIGVNVAQQEGLELAFAAARTVELALRATDVEGVAVELLDADGSAEIVRGAIQATVGAEFELFFRLSGTSDARAQVEVYHPSHAAEVEPTRTEVRFAVTPTRAPAPEPEPKLSKRRKQAPLAQAATEWLDHYADARVRAVFSHMARHGSVTEKEALDMLGGQRLLRRFSRSFEKHAEVAPFDVRIHMKDGLKHYVREGVSS